MATQPYFPLRPRDPAERRRFKSRRLVWRMVQGIREARAVERGLEARQAEIVAALREGHRYRELGHVRFGDFCRIALQLHPRSARRRVAFWGVLSRVPAAGKAFLDGDVDESRILALRTVLTPASAPRWLPLAARLPVRELRRRVEEARTERGDDRSAEDRVADDRVAEDRGGDDQVGDDQVGDDQVGDDQVGDDQLGDDRGAEDRGEAAVEQGAAPPRTGGDTGTSPGGTAVGPPAASTPAYSDEELDEPIRERIAFRAPMTIGLAIEHALETAKRVLGYEAPRDACLEAILDEASSSVPWTLDSRPGSSEDPAGEGTRSGPCGEGKAMGRADGEPSGPGACPNWQPGERLPWADHPFVSARRWRVLRGMEPPGKRRRPARPSGWNPSRHRYDYKRAAHAFASFRRILSRIERLVSGPRAAESRLAPRDLVARYHDLERMSRPLIVARTRMLYHLEMQDAGGLLGFESIEELASRLLGLSERAAREHYVAGCIFQFDHRMSDAYVRGDLGMIYVIDAALKNNGPVKPWIERARSVTYRQFRREMKFLWKLGGILTPGPFGLPDLLPDPQVEALLRKRLFRAGWTPEEIDRKLDKEGLLSPPGASEDPAENPIVMARLEVLLDMVILQIGRTVSNDDPRVRYRKTLSDPEPTHRIVIWARPGIRERWDSACRSVRRETGDRPDWAVAVLLSEAALREWERHDPDRVPTEHRILERDDYRCRVPGCSARRRLESHHIVFRSRGGSNAAWNRVTLCHAHHHHAIHTGTLRVTGRAPHALLWEIGCSPGAEPLWVYRGEKLIRRPAPFPAGRRQPSIRAMDQVPVFTSLVVAERPSVRMRQK